MLFARYFLFAVLFAIYTDLSFVRGRWHEGDRRLFVNKFGHMDIIVKYLQVRGCDVYVTPDILVRY